MIEILNCIWNFVSYWLFSENNSHLNQIVIVLISAIVGSRFNRSHKSRENHHETAEKRVDAGAQKTSDVPTNNRDGVVEKHHDKRYNLAGEISERLNQSLALIVESTEKSKQITLPFIDDNVWDGHDLQTVEDYFNGSIIPSDSFLSGYGAFFGINVDWLKGGRGVPFPMQRKIKPTDCLATILEYKPSKIFFVLSESARKEAILVLQRSEYNYLVVGSDDWPLSLQAVGGGGRSNIRNFYTLIRNVYQEYEFTCSSPSLCDVVLSGQDFKSLVSGRKYPAAILFKSGYLGLDRNWADDFRDINWKFFDREKYARMHGKWFVATQEYIKTILRD